jgi:septum formation protein
MIQKHLDNYNLILASGSPRRQQFFKELGLDFEIRLKSIEEIYPNHLEHHEISDFLSLLKAEPFTHELLSNDILITSDTIVWHHKKALGKPKDDKEAFEMLSSMSNTTHEVITSITLTTTTSQKTVNAVTKVTFKALTKSEIEYYIKTFKPFDKAGAYGIQEWIGQIGITRIEGSYTNVVGLPTHLIYKTLNSMVL